MEVVESPDSGGRGSSRPGGGKERLSTEGLKAAFLSPPLESATFAFTDTLKTDYQRLKPCNLPVMIMCTCLHFEAPEISRTSSSGFFCTVSDIQCFLARFLPVRLQQSSM